MTMTNGRVHSLGEAWENPEAWEMSPEAWESTPEAWESTPEAWESSPRPDNDGRVGRPVILPGAPQAYSSTVDLVPVLSALCVRKAPFTYSTDAGGHVCNHSYFLALDRARSEQSAVPCLFVHIPLPRTSAKRSEIHRAARIVLAWVLHAALNPVLPGHRSATEFQRG